MTSENTTQTAATHLYRAVISCGHEIDRDSVVLHFDPKQPGHNALNQLNLRLAAAYQELAAKHDDQIAEGWPTVEVVADAYEDAFAIKPAGALYVNLAALATALQARAALAAHKEA